MAGAYVAKPAVVVTPDLPPGWNPNWPYPGPLPPGYEPDYSFAMTAPESVAVGNTLNVSAILHDHDTYRTTEPTDSHITWTATIDGESVPLRFEGGSAYGAGVASDYAEISSFWGAEPTLDVQLTEEHNGKTLVLTAYSIVNGAVVAESVEVEVSSGATLTYNWSWSGDLESYALYARATIVVGGSTLASSYWSPSEGLTCVSYTEDIEVEYSGTSATFRFLRFVSEVYSVNLQLQLTGGSATASAEAVLQASGNEYTASLSGTGFVFDMKYPWLTINGTTGEVTIVTP